MFKLKYWFIYSFLFFGLVFDNSILLTLLFADDTLVGEGGHTVSPLNTDKVRMVSEHVKISIKPKESDSYLRWAVVTCEFLFENMLAKELEAKMGFPSSDYSDSEGPYLEPPLANFKSYIDGKQQKVAIRKEILKETESEVFARGKWEKAKFKIYRYWYTWDVIFPPSKKIEITNAYSTNFSTNRDKFWFEYILTPRANWKGKIEKAFIEIIYPSEQELKDRVIEIRPKGYKIEKNRIYWELENFKPKENIKITER